MSGVNTRLRGRICDFDREVGNHHRGIAAMIEVIRNGRRRHEGTGPVSSGGAPFDVHHGY
jgi:hypothetical protein